MISLKTFVVGYFQTNCYVISDHENCAVVVDPGDRSGAIIEYLEKNNLDLRAILITHGHCDHVMAVMPLKRHFKNALIYYNEKDAKLLLEGKESYQVGNFPFDNVIADNYISDGDIITFGEMSFKVVYTPGHSEGSVCYILNDEYIFCGDLIFKDSYGATHFYGGDIEKLASSIKKIFDLNGEKYLYCGHMEPTVLSYERENNPINEQF